MPLRIVRNGGSLPGSTSQSCWDSAEEIVWNTLGGTGAVAHIWPRTGTTGMSRPSIAPTGPHHAPAAITSAPATISPPSVVATQPPAGRGASAVTGRCVRTRAPWRAATVAKACVARRGSACDRSGEYIAPSSAGESPGSSARASRVVSSSTWWPRARSASTRVRSNSYCAGVWITCSAPDCRNSTSSPWSSCRALKTSTLPAVRCACRSGSRPQPIESMAPALTPEAPEAISPRSSSVTRRPCAAR